METDSANPASGSDSATVSDPVAMISGLLEREEAPTKRPASQKPEPEPEDKDPPEPGPEEPPVEPDGEDEEDGEAPEQPEQPEAEPELFTVKVDGKDVAVTRDELLAGYSRQADYSRKTAELAEQRRAAEAEIQRVATERTHYSQQLDQVAAVLQAALPPRPPLEMRDADPIGYQNAKEDWEIRVGQLQTVLAERDRAQQLTAAEQQRLQQQALEQARGRLVELLPEWKKPETAKKEQQELAEYLKAEFGYADHEISAAADPRAIAGFRKAMLYDRLMASKPTVQNKLATAPRMVKPGAAGPAPDQRKAVINQLKRSGGKDIDAAARLIELG